MSSEKENTFYGDAIDGGIDPVVDIAYQDLSLTTQNLLYSLILSENPGTAIQNFAIHGSDIYTTQNWIDKDKETGKIKGEYVVLAKSILSGTTATQKGKVLIQNAGHGQTLEYITKGDFAGSLLFSFSSVKDNNGDNWSTEIGILELPRVEFTESGRIYNSAMFRKFTDLDYANEAGATNHAKIIRADAALSTDQSVILIWTRSEIGLDMFTGYDFNVFCSELAASSSTVSFKNNNNMKNACKFCFAAQTSRISDVPTSIQGIEVSSASNGVYSIYIASGTEKNDGTNRIYRLNSKGEVKKAVKIIHPYFNPGLFYEIEGVKISGDNLLFGLVRTKESGTDNDDIDKKRPFIMKTLKSVLQ